MQYLFWQTKNESYRGVHTQKVNILNIYVNVGIWFSIVGLERVLFIYLITKKAFIMLFIERVAYIPFSTFQ